MVWIRSTPSAGRDGPSGGWHGNQERAYPLTTSREHLLPELISTGPPPFFRDGPIIRESRGKVNRNVICRTTCWGRLTRNPAFGSCLANVRPGKAAPVSRRGGWLPARALLPRGECGRASERYPAPDSRGGQRPAGELRPKRSCDPHPAGLLTALEFLEASWPLLIHSPPRSAQERGASGTGTGMMQSGSRLAARLRGGKAPPDAAAERTWLHRAGKFQRPANVRVGPAPSTRPTLYRAGAFSCLRRVGSFHSAGWKTGAHLPTQGNGGCGRIAEAPQDAESTPRSASRSNQALQRSAFFDLPGKFRVRRQPPYLRETT